MIKYNEFVSIAKARKLIKLNDLDTFEYVLVGSGIYVDELLSVLKQKNIQLPKYILVDEKYKLAVNVEQRIDDGTSLIPATHVVLGTGSFQLEMMQRLLPRCKKNAEFLDVLHCAPQKYKQFGTSNDEYYIYIDLYSDLNIAKYLLNFFKFLNRQAVRIDVFHPLDDLSDEYIKNSQGLIIWNGSLPAFLPVIVQAQRLMKNITYAECGFFPQNQYFYLDKVGVNNQSQLINDSLDWVDSEHMKKLAFMREQLVLTELQEDYIFVPLQVPSDSNILNHSRFKHGMQDFIDFIEQLYPDDHILIKAHPKDRLSRSYKCKRANITFKDTSLLIANAKIVHGINTSVLYEAALSKVDIEVEGECLLKRHIKQIDKLLAAIIYRQFDVNSFEYSAAKLNQFSNISLKYNASNR